MIHALLCAVVLTVTPSEPAQLFAQERAAAGGAAWDAIGEIVEHGMFAGAGLSGPYTSYVDTKTGMSRTALTISGTTQAQGYDAHGAWSQQGGLVEPLEDPASLASARTSAYIARNGWWNPSNDPATFTYLGRKDAGGSSYDVVRVVPRGGNPIEGWIDVATHFLAKTVVTDASNVVTTTTLSDYHSTHGVMYPFATIVSNGNPKYDQHTSVTAVEVSATANVADFTRPKNQRTGTIAGGKTSTTIPFDLDDPLHGHIVIAARVNGSRPLHVVFDTGGSNVVTPQSASAIGLHGGGAVAAGGAGEAQVSVQLAFGATLTVGEATISDQQFGIFPLPASLVGITGKYRIDGIVGYEILKNFVVSIDYVHRRLTLTDPAAFVAPPGATALRFSSATIPVLSASIDGVDGTFMVDTGNAFYNTVSQEFVTAHGLESNLPGDVLVQSRGNIGGAIQPRLTRPATFQIGPYRLPRPVFAVTNTSKGALAGTAFSGNIGEPILTRFNIAFDYGRSTIYLKPNANFAKPYLGTLDGMSLYEPRVGEIRVAFVNHGSPAAAAGLVANDRIVSAKGVAAAKLGLAGIAQLERSRAVLKITYDRGGARHATTLAPQEMVP
jgi:hypothetical protein